MSIKIMSEVWEHAPVSQGALLVLLALADAADEGSRMCFPGIGRLARYSRLKERHVSNCLRELRDAGVIEVARNEGPAGTNLYTITHPSKWGVQKLQGVHSSAEGDALQCRGDMHSSAPKPSEEPSVEPSDSCPHLFSQHVSETEKLGTPDELFDEFWSLYPPRTGSNPKKAARAKFRTALRKVGWAQLRRAVELYARSREGEDPRFTPMASTWLNQERWEDWEDWPGQPRPAARPRMNPDNPMEGIPEHVAAVIRLEIDPEMRDADARAWWARQEAAE